MIPKIQNSKAVKDENAIYEISGEIRWFEWKQIKTLSGFIWIRKKIGDFVTKSSREKSSKSWVLREKFRAIKIVRLLFNYRLHVLTLGSESTSYYSYSYIYDKKEK